MKTALALGLVLTAFFGLGSMQDKNGVPPASAPARPAAKADDVASIDAILNALYDVISGPAGKARDWDRLRSLFTEHARLIATAPQADGSVRRRDMSPDEYVQIAGPRLEKDGFFERESARKLDRFGPVVQVFSTYESRHKADDATPFARGINSIQLLNDGKRWWIVSILWCAETDSLKIPAEYLK